MLNYIVLKNEKGDVTKGQYNRSAEGELVGDITGWSLLFDPKFINDQGAIRNRVERKTFVSALRPYSVKTEGDGALLTIPETTRGMFQPNADINTTEWSAFFVAAPAVIPVGIPNGVFRTKARNVGNASERAMNISFLADAGTLRVYRYGSTNPGGAAAGIVSAAVPAEKVNQLAAYLVTFSVDNGMHVYCDGELIGSNTTFKDPLNFGYSAGEWELYADYVGDAGLAGLVSVDLSKQVYANKRASLFTLLKTRYDLT